MLPGWGNQSPSMKVHLIKSVHKPGFSTTQSIADALTKILGVPVTRNAVAGAYSRSDVLRVECPLSGSNGQATRIASAKGEISQEMNSKLMEKRKAAYRLKLAKEAENEAERKERAMRDEVRLRIATRKRGQTEWEESNSSYIALEALNDTVCRWPIGEREFKFCGHSTAGVSDSVYCSFHRALAYDKPASDLRRYDRERTAKLSLPKLSNDA